MPDILFLGSGFVAGPCLTHLLKRADYFITIACRTLETAQKLSKGHPQTQCISLDVSDKEALGAQVAKHDLVISLVPYIHHAKVIEQAVKYKKHVVSTSYVNPQMAEYHQAAIDAGITCFNEVGVDPGIDHLYAIKMIDEVHKAGGLVKSFLSYCGGLPAPEASNNPLGYKFSWSSRGVLLALRNACKYWEDGVIKATDGPDLMNIAKPIFIYPAFAFVGYPNRDSSPYTERYNIPECKNLIRGTLRYQGWPTFAKVLVNLGFLDETPKPYLAAGSSPISWAEVTKNITGAESTEENVLIAAVTKYASVPADDHTRIIQGLKWLGLFSDKKAHLKNNLLDTMCATMDELMQFEEGERDMIMLQHKFEIEFPETGKKETRTSTGLWYGTPGGESAMATTVGIPCAITVQLILDGKITQKGVLAPMTMELCAPIIDALKEEGIYMTEATL